MDNKLLDSGIERLDWLVRTTEKEEDTVTIRRDEADAILANVNGKSQHKFSHINFASIGVKTSKILPVGFLYAHPDTLKDTIKENNNE